MEIAYKTMVRNIAEKKRNLTRPYVDVIVAQNGVAIYNYF